MKISNFKFQISNSKGFSILEVILASVIFIFFASAAIGVIIQGFSANRQGAEETIANQFASEGIEAVKSIKNQGYSNLSSVNPTPRAVKRNNINNVWEFDPTDGSTNTLNSGKTYIRTVKVESVYRDLSCNIVASGGNLDPDTKKITSSVLWDTVNIPGLVGYWDLNEGSGQIGEDSSGNLNNGTLGASNASGSDDPLWASSKAGLEQALDFDGVNDRFVVPDPSNGVLNFGTTGDFTIVGWFNRQTSGTNDVIVSKKNSITSGTVGYIVYINSSGYLSFRVSDNPDQYDLRSTTTQINSSGWNHFAVVWDDDSSANTKIYINGTLDNTANYGSTIESIDNISNSSTFEIGSDGGGGDYFDGLIDEIKIYNRVLSSDEISSLYSGQGGTSKKIDLITYLTDWRKPINPTSTEDGIIVYGKTGNINLRNRIFDKTENKFSIENSTLDGTVPLNVRVAVSPTKIEAIAGYVNSSGTLQIMCYNGTNWVNEWNDTVGGNGSDRRFDIAYETSSGDAMVFYSTGKSGTTVDMMRYRTKPGSNSCGASNWTNYTSLNTFSNTTVVHWLKMTSDKRPSSNLIAAAYTDANQDLWPMVWNGDADTWKRKDPQIEGDLTTPAFQGDRLQRNDTFDIEFESSSGNIMLVWGYRQTNSNKGVRYARCNGGANCTWTSASSIGLGQAYTLDFSADPASNGLFLASINDANPAVLQAGYWNGLSWTTNTNLDSTSTPIILGTPCVHCYTKYVATGVLNNGSQKRAIITYYNSGATVVSYRSYNPSNNSWSPGSGEPSTFTPSPAFATQKWYDIQTDPFNQEQLLFTLSDVDSTNNRLFTKKLTMDLSGVLAWSEPDVNSSASPLEAALPQAIASPFSFAYWRYRDCNSPI